MNSLDLATESANPDLLHDFRFRYPPRAQISHGLEEYVDLGPTEAAALRQFDLLRLMAYGVEPGDATRLLESVADGCPWESTAKELEAYLEEHQRRCAPFMSPMLEQELLERRSALLRISQAMEVRNTSEKQTIYLQAANLFQQAKRIDGNYRQLTIESAEGPLNAWLITPIPGNKLRGSVLIHGGVDGWSMDWDGLGREFTAEGYATLILDGPGQGESRYLHNTYLSKDWILAYKAVIKLLYELADGGPVFAVGNSMAAGLMLQVQKEYDAFDGVCSNGPVRSMSALLARTTYATKLASFCGNSADVESARSIFETLDLDQDAVQSSKPVLLLQGDEDPMVPVDDGIAVLEWVGSARPSLAIFERGEHVLNRFPSDKHTLMRLWMRSISKEPSTTEAENQVL